MILGILFNRVRGGFEGIYILDNISGNKWKKIPNQRLLMLEFYNFLPCNYDTLGSDITCARLLATIRDRRNIH